MRKEEQTGEDTEAQILELEILGRSCRWEVDAQGRFTCLSESIYNLTGYTARELLEGGYHFYDLFPESEREELKTAAFKVFAQRQPFVEFENPMVTKSGRTIWMSTNGTPVLGSSGQLIGYRGTDRDITEQRRMQDNLERQNVFLDSIIDAVQSAVVVVNRTGDIVFANPAARTVLGLSITHGDLYAYNDPRWGIEAVDGTTIRNEDLPFNIILRTGRPVRGMRMAIRKDGKDRRIIEVSGNPVFSEDHEIESVVFSVTDVTQLEEAAKELLAAKQRAEAANTAKSQFLSNMSHELRTPLNAIMGMADLLDMSELNAEQRDEVEVIARSASSLLYLINEILDLARIEEDKLIIQAAPFNPSTLLNDLDIDFRKQAADKGIGLSLQVASNMPPRVIASESLIRRIVENLLDNAVKFTSEGHIHVAIGLIQWENGETVLEVCVEDTGTGFPPEMCDEIFERFHQVDNTSTRRFGGVGLGLSIVRELARRLGGVISAESPIQEAGPGCGGPGARFRVQIPCKVVTSRPAPALPVQEKPALPELPKALRVLIVEDNPINRSVTESFLKHLEFETETAADGRDAVRKMAEKPFDIVLMDISMPIMDGFDALKIIRGKGFPEHARCTPVIAVTAHAMSGDRESFLEAGFNDYLAKPYKFDQLQELIGRVLAEPDR